jgi:pilus assembly protein Flp/PilA
MRRLTARARAVGSALRADDGATAVEYALMVGLIALVVVSGVTLLGVSVNDVFANFHIP